jgi:uncharacterized membrane protein
MTKGFAASRYHDSVLAALAQINSLLTMHYPQIDEQRNQLSDKPILL